MRKTLDFFGQDQAILTQEEVKHVRETVVEAIHHKLIGRDYFPVVENPHPGAKFYVYYTAPTATPSCPGRSPPSGTATS